MVETITEEQVKEQLDLVERGKPLTISLSVLNLYVGFKKRYFKIYEKDILKEYRDKPEFKAKMKAYHKKYSQKPEVRAKARAYNQKPEVKARKKAYSQKPEVKARRKAYYQKKKLLLGGNQNA